MIPFADALRLILESAPPAGTERIRIEDSVGRVLREPVSCDRPFPPFDRVMMDGIALRSRDVLLGFGDFLITGAAAAGHEPPALPPAPGSCVEVMTGSPLPPGADCVVPVEETMRLENGSIHLSGNANASPGRNIHPAGSDAQQGQTILSAGIRIGSRQIGAAASCGAAWLTVSKLPRIIVFATGDELAAVDDTPSIYQIRQSNAHAIRAALWRAGYPVARTDTLPDDPDAGKARIGAALANCDWLILTGAVSKGARDFIPSALDGIGCERIFHGIAQRPGKPAGCWKHPSGTRIAALPGNPVSALTCLHALVLPALEASVGLTNIAREMVRMDSSVRRLPDSTCHLPVTLRDGTAYPAPVENSGDFTGLLRSDGFLTLPPAGTDTGVFPFTPWF
ncbi:MAG: molybdopterin molybdotransferase MoeA [Verrucomicrobia bacterium]|nr:molybdopterin molybdotransferase MoeA [Verrucomicrobiota bacterium]